MSDSVELRPGQTLVIKVVSKTLAGKPGESSYPFTYEDLMQHLRAKTRVARRSRTPGTKLSRHISLLANAFAKGVWATGAPIKRLDTIETLIRILTEAVEKDATEITPNAKKKLGYFLSRDGLHAGHKAALVELAMKFHEPEVK